MKKIGTVAAASIGAFAVGAAVAGGLAIANAGTPAADQTAQDSQNTQTQQNPQDGKFGPGMGHRDPGELVTGDDAQAAIDAATAQVAGTADRVYKSADGNYLVMVTTTDAKHVLVTLDAQFTVTGQKEMPARGDGRGPGHGPGTAATAEQTQQATDAVLTRYPGATVLQVFVRDGDGFAVLIRTGDGHKKVVLLDEQYAIQSVENLRKHHGKRGPHGKQGHHKMGHDVTGPAFRKAEQAALQKVPGGTVMDVHKKGKKYYAFVKKDDGSVVIVVMNSGFTVTGTKDLDFPRHQLPRNSTSPSAVSPSATAPSAA